MTHDMCDRPLVLFCGRQFNGHSYCFLPNGHRGEQHGDVPDEDYMSKRGDFDALAMAAIEARWAQRSAR